VAPVSPPLRCVCITGPTACGKTELALHLAQAMPIEIISMDSAMVYRGMDIGTAKPDAAARAAVPHHLIDILDPAEAYSAGRFAHDALEAVGAITARGRLPVLVGGTLLYLRALRDGLARLPRANSAVREKLDAEAAARGWEALHERLRALDPVAAQRIAPTDPQRIQRALEVYELTGRPLTEMQRDLSGTERPDVLVVGLVPANRDEHRARIALRFDAMVESGFVAEVQALKARGDLHPDLPSMRAVGYRQIWTFLDGACDWTEARRRAIVATGQLAKRQLTWLRSDRRGERWPAFSADLLERLAERIVAQYE
jgi:tRNA dimethylallyltransferase